MQLSPQYSLIIRLGALHPLSRQEVLDRGEDIIVALV